MRKPVIIVWRVKSRRVVSLDRKFWLNAAYTASRHIPLLVGVAIGTPAPVMAAGLAAETFKPGGFGASIVQMLLIAAFGTLATYIISALGQGQIAKMTKLATVFGCIAICINLIWSAISAIASFFKVAL